MSIILVGPVHPYRGGIAHFTACLARAFGGDKACQVVSFRRLYPKWLYPGVSDHDPSTEPLRVPAKYFIDTLNPLTWLKAGRWIAERGPKGVVFQWWTTFLSLSYLLLPLYLRRSEIPLLFLIHNVFPHEARFFDRRLAAQVLRQGDVFLALSEREQERLRSIVPARKRVEVYPHPPYDFFQANPIPREEAKRRLGLPKRVPALLFFGFVRPYKGVAQLIEAMTILRSKGVELRLMIVGEIWGDRSEYEQMIEEQGLAGHVLLEDRYIPNEEVAVYFFAADIFVAPYLHGTQSGAANIATTFDLPIVASEQIAESLAGVGQDHLFVAPPGDSLALAEAIQASLAAIATPNPQISARSSDVSWEGLAKRIHELLGAE